MRHPGDLLGAPRERTRGFLVMAREVSRALVAPVLGRRNLALGELYEEALSIE